MLPKTLKSRWEKIPELIIQAKERIDRLEGQTQEILRQKEQAREELDEILQEHDTIVAELEKYKKEIRTFGYNQA